MIEEKKDKKFPEPLEVILLIISVILLLIVLMGAYAGLTGKLKENNPDFEDIRFIYIFGGSFFLVIPLIYARYREYDIKKSFRFHSVPASTLLFSIFFAVALAILGDELDRIFSLILPLPESLKNQLLSLKATTQREWILIILGAVIVASVAEESLFRGFLQVSLEKKGDVTRAVLLSSLTWMLIHMNLYWAVQIFFTGIFIGFIAWRTNSVIPPIIVHSVNNLIAILYLGLGEESNLEWYEWKGHVSPLILIISVLMMVYSIRQLNLIHRRT
jgi:hypothetical protein